ncbi:unnamed protein product [Rotaria sp. Silwood1]|nr:unnamed protein product [Rotaria sp. Silwood1]
MHSFRHLFFYRIKIIIDYCFYTLKKILSPGHSSETRLSSSSQTPSATPSTSRTTRRTNNNRNNMQDSLPRPSFKEDNVSKSIASGVQLDVIIGEHN